MNLFETRRLKLFLVACACAGATLLAGCGGGDSSPSPPPPSASLAFITPPPGATVEVGKTLAIKLKVTNPDEFNDGIAVIGQAGLGAVGMTPESPSATLTVPSDLDLGDYSLTAVGPIKSSQNPVTTSTIVRVVPNPAVPIELQLPQGALTFEAIGERLPITVSGARKGALQYVSAVPAIATATAAGIVIARKTGDTTIRISLAPPSGSFVGSVPVHVLAPALLPSVTGLDFGTQPAGRTSAPQSVTVTNQAAYPVKVLAVSAGTVFPFAGDCKSSSPLAPGASCTISVNFAPTATGSVSGALMIVGSAVVAPTRILLSGTGS